jgi:hypothetical protein
MPNGNTNRAYVTRINLDVAHPDHRITLLTPGDANFLTGFNSIDGSTWDPFSHTLLFTQEAGANGGVIEMGAILIQTPAVAPVCARCMAASGAAVMKAFILMTGATS